MPCLIKVFDEIVSDFSRPIYEQSSVLSRNYILPGKTVLFISVYKHTKVTEISLSLFGDTADGLSNLPKWKGMDQKIGIIEDHLYVSFKQSEDYDRDIFLLIMQDIVDNVESIDNKYLVESLNEVLLKWSAFFQFEKEYVLSDSAQQGLYAELHVLEKMLEQGVAGVIECWTGYNAETHDFYIGKDAVEVKSSSAKGPEKIKISNEYQLDNTGIVGRLYLMYLKLKKSEIYGENLPTIVKRIFEKLSLSDKISFQTKLLKVGYLYQMPELYKLNFIIIDESAYIVEDGFPKITKHNIQKGIGSVDYVVSLGACEKFLITVESFYGGVTH